MWKNVKIKLLNKLVVEIKSRVGDCGKKNGTLKNAGGGWVGGWVGRWMDGWMVEPVKGLQQSKTFLANRQDVHLV